MPSLFLIWVEWSSGLEGVLLHYKFPNGVVGEDNIIPKSVFSRCFFFLEDKFCANSAVTGSVLLLGADADSPLFTKQQFKSEHPGWLF